MGAFCFKADDDEPDAVQKGHVQVSRISFLPKSLKANQIKQAKSGVGTSCTQDTMTQHTKLEGSSDEWDVVTALDEIIDRRVGVRSSVAADTPADYLEKRIELKQREGALGFEHKFASTASDKETRVDRILQDLKRDDNVNVYAVQPRRKGWGGQLHARFAGDHFLSNKTLIDGSKVFRLAQRLPKGAHLHIHFNACLQPHVLLEIASGMEQMYITSDLPLLAADDYHNYKRAKIQFSIMTHPASTGSLFDESYRDRNGAMKFKEFIDEFPRHYHPHQSPTSGKKKDALLWLQERLVFREEEAHGSLQTVAGAWEEFNTRTQMMKGLFNYETAYRTYTRKCLEDFMDDNIQYAEIRPNFMDTNQVWTDDGTKQIDNEGIVEMIIEEYETFQAAAEANGRGRFGGLKIIYCCPRSWPNQKVAGGLKECLIFKKKWPQWIAGKLEGKGSCDQRSSARLTYYFSALFCDFTGFDLVGEEGKGKPLKNFVGEFLQFQHDCRTAGVEIPFLFHCGETLDSGSATDDNLLDALLLQAKRIGHGFALARHPYLLEQMKQAGVCLEVCPISNEALGLTPRMGGHAMYNLLANNVHCTVNSDNGTLFK